MEKPTHIAVYLKVADSLISVSRQLGITTTAVITEMDNPLGNSIGNALEVIFIIRVERDILHSIKELFMVLSLGFFIYILFHEYN